MIYKLKRNIPNIITISRIVSLILGFVFFMKNKIIWKDVTLIVLAILLIFSMCRIHTLKQSNKKLYSQNLELNHQLATLKEKNAGLESKLNSEESITDEKKSDNSQH